VSGLVRANRPEDGVDALRARLDDREAALSAQRDEIARAHADLAAFRLRYRRDVGRLHEELEELERGIAEAELGEFARRLADEGKDGAQAADATPRDATPRLTSDSVRKLFRDVAKTIHPDLARDAQARDRRHTLMIEANRAYALGDEERLRSILDAWERSPEAVQGSDEASARERLRRRLAQIDEQIVLGERELADLRETPLWKLKVMVDEADARGKDLVEDMVRRLKRDIIAARNRLDAMRWNP
jgi:hypothetical protein